MYMLYLANKWSKSKPLQGMAQSCSKSNRFCPFLTTILAQWLTNLKKIFFLHGSNFILSLGPLGSLWAFGIFEVLKQARAVSTPFLEP